MDNSNLVVETKLYNLSTRGTGCKILNSNTDYKSRCEYFIPNMIVRDENVEFIQFSIPTAIIPVSFFVINENNNQLKVLISGITTTYTFPVGNYNANTFISQFSITLGAYFVLALNSTNNIFTITKTFNPNDYTTQGINFTILGSSTISSVMGFSTNLAGVARQVSITQGITTTTGLYYDIVCTRCCNFLPLPRVSLRCAELANTTMVGNNSSSNDVIITIPNNGKPNGQIYYQNQSQAKLLFRHNELSRFVVSLTDDDGNYLNFNGISSFFTFQFDIFRRYLPNPPSFSSILEHVNRKVLKQYFPDEEKQQNEDIYGYT